MYHVNGVNISRRFRNGGQQKSSTRRTGRNDSFSLKHRQPAVLRNFIHYVLSAKLYKVSRLP